ncbi:IclR family transcriptional regulator [Sulfobacillus thermosulfidooxidans]|uniref:IclR family transcriptional regulator n=1 Tax=Sulfobacillus thermosulfidooxidans TaxID=28034 RepID=UPI0006B42410|nr:IclR family transcriptional regulator [Sulfobacillus thermosulfidooxidans]
MSSVGLGVLPPESDGQVRVQSVERAFRLLEKLVLHNEMSLGQLADAVGMHKSTVYRLLHTLMELGYVEQDGEQGSYRVGIRMVEMGGIATRSWPLHRAAEPVMDQLAEFLGEAVNLAVEDGMNMVYIATVDAYNLLRMQLNIGRRAPIHCTAVGKALLAYRPELVQRMKGAHPQLTSYTAHTITDWAALEDELVMVRQLGFAVDDEEQEVGARCVAAPIVDSRNHIVASIGISAPAARLSRERAMEVGPEIVKAAQQVSERLGSLRKK